VIVARQDSTRSLARARLLAFALLALAPAARSADALLSPPPPASVAAPAAAPRNPVAPAAAVPPAATASAPSTSRPDCPPPPPQLTREDIAAGKRAAVDSGFLWRATKDGRAVYLYGTIHIAQRDWMFPGPRVLAALRESPDVALELDPTDPQIVTRLQRAIHVAVPLRRRLGSCPVQPPDWRAQRLAIRGQDARRQESGVAPARVFFLRP